MRNKSTIVLPYINAVIIAFICIVQIYILSKESLSFNISMGEHKVYYYGQIITLFLGTSAMTVIFVKESLDRVQKRNAYTDITGIMNKHACVEQMSILDCRESTLDIGLAMFDLNNLKKVNDFYGHEEGDRLIQQFVALLRQTAEKKYFLGRFGGDEFIVIIQNCEEKGMLNFFERISKETERNNRSSSIRISYACGYAISTREHYYLMDELLKEADKRMYENKKMIKSGELMKTNQISKILDADRVNAAEKNDLTGTFGHDTFVSTVEKVLQIYNSNSRLALVCSDVHNFRYFNDLYGHKEGDHLLRQFALELNQQPFCLCSYRLYSDNFAFLADLSQLSEEQAVERIRNWNIQFSSMVDQAYRGSRFIVNSGIYFISDISESVESMLNNADCARKNSKSAFNHIVVYSEKLNQAMKLHSDIVNSFQRALENQEFQIYVQPKVSCGDKKVCGAEALVRWQRGDGMFLSPDTFVPILEQSGDIINLDFYVYEKVFEYLYNRQLKNKASLPMSVNVSRVHLSMLEDFMERINALHEQYPIPTSLITFELTESAYIKEIHSAERFIDCLYAKGYRVSMDDFGSGYSSLKALYPMNFDEIKFDRAFMKKDAAEEEEHLLIGLIKLVKGLNTTIVCEGVETAENVKLLESSGCDVFQGYYYYRPFPLEELDALIDDMSS
ncbi:EAL domain-containing protein [Aminipila butyrica]|uniref:EAL domain-containing protein n=1 Tax=Aminipila butyrica TaxID=433296 RepID=A0A858BYQ8_9FIRM|nr:EAL domain-containing protein [Aminipila butyrica]QIB70265.1 EAL domain-containing protein [Aminipila butyrica]